MSDETIHQNEFPLNELIGHIRAELVEAVKRRDTAEGTPDFTVESITLEVNFVVEKTETATGGAKASLWAVGFNASGEKTYKTEQVHKVTLELKAWQKEKPSHDPDGGHVNFVPAGGSGTFGMRRQRWICDIPGFSVPAGVVHLATQGKVPVKGVLDILHEINAEEATLGDLNATLQKAGVALITPDCMSKHFE